MAVITLAHRPEEPRFAEALDVGMVHDYLLALRGAERTFAEMIACWPQAPVSTLLYDERGTEGVFADRVARTSYLQRLPVSQRNFRMLLPAFPLAAERLAVGEHAVIVSSSSAFAHGIRPPEGTLHVNYCHSPFRYVWHERDRALREFPRPMRASGARLLERIRRWDVRAAERVDHFIANSRLTQQRIARVWNRDAVVVHPPVAVDRFHLGEPEDYFVIVGELVAHKRVDAGLEAARRAGVTVKVVGEGPIREELEARFADSAEFLGRVDDRALADLLARASGMIVCNVEEFGIAAVEAMASGRPVFAPDQGGTSETVCDGVTGVLYPAGDFDALSEALRFTDVGQFAGPVIREHALRYRPELFRRRLTDEVHRALGHAELAREPELVAAG